MSRTIFLLAALLLRTSALAEPSVIFLIRHAERADSSGPAEKDPPLSDAGQARAAGLAKELRDAGITAIYTSEYQRTQQTAAPLAASLGVKPEVVSAKETTTLIEKLRARSGNVLVVGHSNTLPEITKALGISALLTLGENDYDDLFIVTLDPVPRLLHLHYR